MNLDQDLSKLDKSLISKTKADLKPEILASFAILFCDSVIDPCPILKNSGWKIRITNS